MTSPEQYFSHITPYEHPAIPNEPDLEQIKGELIEKIKEVKQSGDSIGEGRTAEVFISEKDSRICYKVIKPEFSGYRIRSNKEGEILGELCALPGEVKIPMPYYSILSEDGFEALVMERIDGVSIEDIVREKTTLPDGMEIDDFFGKIKRFFETMHQEHHTYHRDIHPGNIMIERNTLRPCIIDFGAGRKCYGDNENPYRETDARGKMIVSTDDEVGLRDTKNALRKHLFSKTKN